MGWTELLEQCRDRHGVVSLACGTECDVSEAALRGRARRERWPNPHRGTWVVPPARDTRAARHVAAGMVVPGPFRGASALYVHGTGRPAPDPPQLLLPHGFRHRTRDGIDVRRTRHLPEEDVTDVRAHPTTTVARAVADLAATWSVPRLRSLVLDLERDGHLRHEDLSACHGRLPRGFRGRGRVGLVVEELQGLRSDSDTEHEIRRDLLMLGYPVHPEPFPFRCDDDVVVRLDLALPAHWVYLEVDGRGVHLTTAFETDRIKWNQVVRQWRPVWVTAERWRRDRAGVLADLDAAIALADISRPPATPWPASTTASGP